MSFTKIIKVRGDLITPCSFNSIEMSVAVTPSSTMRSVSAGKEKGGAKIIAVITKVIAKKEKMRNLVGKSK